jgi:O-antigen/teichoic acid export membrane protein
MFTAVGIQTSIVVAALLTHKPIVVFSAGLLATALVIPINFAVLPRSRRRDVLRVRFPRHLPKGFWPYCNYTAAATMGQTIIGTDSEIYVLKLYHQTTAVGLFALAFGIAAQVTAPVDAMISPLLPAIAGLVATAPSKSKEAFLRALRLSAILSGALMATVVTTMFFLIPVLYGSDYHSTADLFVPLAVLSCIASVFNPVTVFVVVHRRGRLVLGVTAIGIAVDVGLSFGLIPIIGVWGAVVANCVTTAVMLAIWLVSELQTLDLKWEEVGNATGGIWIAGLIGSMSALLTGWFIPGGPIVSAAAAGVAGTFVFLVTMRLSRCGLREAEQKVVLDMVPSRVGKVIRPLIRITGVDTSRV